MTPDYKRLLKGVTTWRENYRGVAISLSHHGYMDGTEYPGAQAQPGTWCYYLHLMEEMFRPEDWSEMWVDEVSRDWGISYAYENFPDVDFHGGITFYERNNDGWDKAKKQRIGRIKVGCDYAHLWNSEMGYPDTYESVLMDAKRTVDELLELFPDRRTRCEYSGVWGEADEFYKAANGRTVHRFYANTFDIIWEGWRPTEVIDDRATD